MAIDRFLINKEDVMRGRTWPFFFVVLAFPACDREERSETHPFARHYLVLAPCTPVCCATTLLARNPNNRHACFPSLGFPLPCRAPLQARTPPLSLLILTRTHPPFDFDQGVDTQQGSNNKQLHRTFSSITFLFSPSTPLFLLIITQQQFPSPDYNEHR